MVNPILLGSGITAGIILGGVIYPLFDLTKATSIKLRNDEGEFEPVIETPRKKHGLIVLGDGGNEFFRRSIRNTSDLVYKTLKENGYEDENLYLLEGKKGPKERFACHSLPSSKKHLREVLNHLYRDVGPEDTFFMYVLTHGGTTGIVLPIGQSTLLLDRGSVREKELEELLSDLHPNHSLTYFNSCYSGGFAQRLGKGRNIAISTSRKHKVTSNYVGPEIKQQQGNYASNFTLNFFSALRRHFPSGDEIELKDGSIDGFFDFAAKRAQLSDTYLGWLSNNTPLLVYEKINPKDVRL